MKRICINCGSNHGADEIYRVEAANLGKYLARRGIGIVFGGADVGLMGEIANAALAEKGEVIGVIPESLAAKVAHRGLSKLHVVPTMHQRKQLMFDLADGVIAFPGGLGTLDEIFEVITWGQLGQHQKPCGFLNIENYFGKLLEFLDFAVEKKFIKPPHRDMIISENNIEKLLEKFYAYQPPTVEKWFR